MALHPAAWLAWLTAVSVFAFLVTNPLYTVLALCAVLVVHLSFPVEHSPVGRAVRTFLVFGIVLLGVRMVFVAVLPNPGETTLFTVPSVSTPRWLGALELGGAVSAEVVVYALADGLRLVTVLAAFGVFNARADLSSLLRSVPGAFRDVGLVVSIAVAFVPGMLRTVHDVRDAQRLRGEWGLRRLAPSLVVPVLGLSLERALLLAESMDVRGYGRGAASRSSRVYLWTGLVAACFAVAVWAGGRTQAATVLAVGAAAAIVWGFRVASVSSGTSRLAGRRVRLFDIAVIAASAMVVAGVMLASPDAAYEPYPTVAWPAFAWTTAAITLLIALPALSKADA